VTSYPDSSGYGESEELSTRPGKIRGFLHPTRLVYDNTWSNSMQHIRSIRHPRQMLFTAVLAVLALIHVNDRAIAKEPPKKPTSLAIITNWGGDSCSLVDIKGGKELAQIQVGLKPYDVKVDPKGRFAYVTCSGADHISIIDIQAMLEMTDQRITVGESPRDIDLTRDGRCAVVANAGSDTISVVDIATRKQLYTVPVGSIPYGVALTADDKRALITCWGSNKAVIVDLGDTAGTVVKSIDVGILPYTAVISKEGRIAIVSCFGSHKVFPIDMKNMAALPAVDVGRSPWGLSISSDGKKALVANFYSGDASILAVDDSATDPIKATPPPVREHARMKLSTDALVGASTPSPMRAKNTSFTNDPNEALLTNLGRNELIVLDLATQKVVKTIPVGKAPYGIAFVPNGP